MEGSQHDSKQASDQVGAEANHLGSTGPKAIHWRVGPGTDQPKHSASLSVEYLADYSRPFHHSRNGLEYREQSTATAIETDLSKSDSVLNKLVFFTDSEGQNLAKVGRKCHNVILHPNIKHRNGWVTSKTGVLKNLTYLVCRNKTFLIFFTHIVEERSSGRAIFHTTRPKTALFCHIRLWHAQLPQNKCNSAKLLW